MKIVILGGGISGLSAAWYTRKRYPEARITLLEKQDHLGGWIQSVKSGGFFFEKGPRTFMVSRSPALLELIEEVGLKGEIIYSDQAAGKRYLWHRGKLRSMSSLIPFFLPALIREAFIPRKELEDESIADFATRRFGRKMADLFFDPMVLGVFAGDMRHLSLRSCFPFLHEWEQEKKSLLRALFFRKEGPKGLFTLRHGMGSLVQALQNKTPIEIVTHCPVEEILPEGVRAGGKFWGSDRIICALPGLEIGRITHSWVDFSSLSIWVISFVFPEKSLSKKGFGYLVPSQENEPLLGAIWDSSIFPVQNRQNEVRLTAMVRDLGDASWAVATAQEVLRRHLRIEAPPLYVAPHYALNAIPQFEVGYAKRLSQFQEELKQKIPSLSFVGNYLEGASVDSCIRRAKIISTN